MKLSTAFENLDDYLKRNLKSITCNEIFEIKKDFYSAVELLCGSTANLTGITELLIFRFIYHTLKMDTPVDINQRAVHNNTHHLFIGKSYIGKNKKKQMPDIIIEKNGTISHLISIKNLLSTLSPTKHEKESILVQELIKENGVCTSAIQDIFRIDNIRYGKNSNFNSITIVFSKLPPRHQKAVEIIERKFSWHKFIVLEGNSKSLLQELNDKLGI
jgi:hypothetical protein